MPKKPKRPCSYPGCPELTDRRFCEEHAKRKLHGMKSMTVTQQLVSDMVVHGREYVTATLQLILFARSVNGKGS